MKIRTKLSVFATFLVTVIVATVSVFIFIAERKLLQDELKESQVKIIRSLAQISKEALIIGDNLIIINYLNFVKRTNPAVLYGYVVDKYGNIIAHTDAKFIGYIDARLGFEERDSQSITERSFLTRHELFNQYPFLGEHELGIKVYELSLAAWRKGERKVTAKMGFMQKAIEATLTKTLDRTRRRILFIAIVTLLAGVFLAFIVSYTISRPIKTLAQGINLLGQGKLDTEIKVKTKDELGWLADEFNKMSRQLKELDKMKDEFVSNVTHELRSPLGAIESYINLMLEQDEYYHIDKGIKSSVNIDLVERHHHMQRIRKNTGRLGRFINDLLDIAKIEAGRMQLNKQVVNIPHLVEDIVSLFTIQAKAKDITINTIVDPLIGTLYIDEDKIKQVLTNLLNNAIKFSSNQGDIVVKAVSICAGEERSKTAVYSVEFSVSDTGMGIPEEYKIRVFDKFEQVADMNKKRGVQKGTGLGLSIAKGIIEAHGGKIWVESGVDKGSTFFFSLPAVVVEERRKGDNQ
ncbi:ATP-binding protein [bacterium]